MDTFIEDKNKKKLIFTFFFLSFIAQKKCTNLSDRCNPLKKNPETNRIYFENPKLVK
jgi:hypothetical protein